MFVETEGETFLLCRALLAVSMYNVHHLSFSRAFCVPVTVELDNASIHILPSIKLSGFGTIYYIVFAHLQWDLPLNVSARHLRTQNNLG